MRITVERIAAGSSLLLQMDGQDEIVPVVFNFWTCPRQRVTTTQQQQSVAEPHRNGACLCVGISVSEELRQRTLYHRFVMDAFHDINIIFKPGRE